MNKRWISDRGPPRVLVGHGIDGSEKAHVRLPRYSVWEPQPDRQSMKVVESSDDLEALQTKYGPGIEIFKIKTESQILSEFTNRQPMKMPVSGFTLDYDPSKK